MSRDRTVAVVDPCFVQACEMESILAVRFVCRKRFAPRLGAARRALCFGEAISLRISLLAERSPLQIPTRALADSYA